MDLIGLAQFKTFKYHPVFEPFPHESLKPRLFGYSFYWLVVEPTHLKNIKSQWESSPNRDENKKIFETTTQFKEVPHPVGNKEGELDTATTETHQTWLSVIQKNADLKNTQRDKPTWRITAGSKWLITQDPWWS